MTNDAALEVLESAEEWDFDRAERRPAIKNGRAVLSVAFPRPDYDRVTRCADQLHMRTSEFVREAALEKANCHQQRAVLTAFSASPGVTLYSLTPFAITRALGTAAQLGNKGASY